MIFPFHHVNNPVNFFCTDSRHWAERKLGGMLKETENQRPAGARGIGKSGVPPEYPTLSELGLSRFLRFSLIP